MPPVDDSRAGGILCLRARSNSAEALITTIAFGAEQSRYERQPTRVLLVCAKAVDCCAKRLLTAASASGARAERNYDGARGRGAEVEAEDLLQKAQEAAQAGDWTAAKQGFEAALELDESGEALFGFGIALQWLGDPESAIRHWERAYADFRRRGVHSRRCSPRSTSAWATA